MKKEEIEVIKKSWETVIDRLPTGSDRLRIAAFAVVDIDKLIAEVERLRGELEEEKRIRPVSMTARAWKCAVCLRWTFGQTICGHSTCRSQKEAIDRYSTAQDMPVKQLLGVPTLDQVADTMARPDSKADALERRFEALRNQTTTNQEMSK